MKTTLVIHIRSGSVSAGLVCSAKGKLPEVVSHAKQNFRTDNLPEKAMILSLRKVLKKMFDKGVQEVMKRGFPTDVDHTIISVSGRWLDEKEKEYADPELVKAIELEVGRALGIRRGVAFHSFPQVFHGILTGLEVSPGKVLLVDFGSDTTHATLLNGVGRMPTQEFGFGAHSLVEILSRELGVSYVIAQSLLSLYARGDLDESANRKMELILGNTEDKWRKHWQEALSGIFADRIIVISDRHTSNLARTLAWSVANGARVSVVGEDLRIAPQIIRTNLNVHDEPIAVLASFSASLL